MGLNAYFTYQVVGVRGTGPIPYRIALTAIFAEGWIFLFLALTGMRHWLVKMIPGTIKTASGVGIGLFLTLIGMSYTSGIGIITGSTSTPLTLGGCPVEDLSPTGECTANIMRSPKVCTPDRQFSSFLFIDRGSNILIAVGRPGLWWPVHHLSHGVSGQSRHDYWHSPGLSAVLAVSHGSHGVFPPIFADSCGARRNTSMTYFPNTEEGDRRWDFFSKVVAFHPIQHTLAQQQWDLTGVNSTHFVMALLTFVYVDIIDCTATLYSMARFCNKVRKGERDFPRSTVAYCIDAICISIGSLFGCSPVTAFIESGAGIAEGGRTGLTAIVTGCCFLMSLFLAPIFASIPPWATGSTLILVRTPHLGTLLPE